MIQLVVKVICINPATGREVCLAQVESSEFDPNHADDQIVLALDNARVAANGVVLDSLRAWQPEVSVRLVALDEVVRPSMHLASRTVEFLALAGAALDFDPYV